MSEEQSASFFADDASIEIIDSDTLPTFVPARPADSDQLEDDYDLDDPEEY